MREIDEVRIEGTVLTIYDTKGERHRFKMGVPEQVFDEVTTKLGEPDVRLTGVRFLHGAEVGPIYDEHGRQV